VREKITFFIERTGEENWKPEGILCSLKFLCNISIYSPSITLVPFNWLAGGDKEAGKSDIYVVIRDRARFKRIPEDSRIESDYRANNRDRK